MIVCGGTPRRDSTCHNRFRSTESYAFWMPMKQRKSGVPAFRRSSCSQRTTRIVSMIDQDGRKPLCPSGRSPLGRCETLDITSYISLTLYIERQKEIDQTKPEERQRTPDKSYLNTISLSSSDAVGIQSCLKKLLCWCSVVRRL